LRFSPCFSVLFVVKCYYLFSKMLQLMRRLMKTIHAGHLSETVLKEKEVKYWGECERVYFFFECEQVRLLFVF
jgi:hypothetical protein